MTCTGCANAAVIVIRMRIGGDEVTFSRCARCEVNHWAGYDGELSLDRVLELARSAK